MIVIQPSFGHVKNFLTVLIYVLGQRITQKAEIGKESTHLEKKILNNAKPKILQIPHILFGSFAQLAKTVFEKRPYQASKVRGVGHHIFS